MDDASRKDTIALWVSDFLDAAAFREHPALLREYAPEVLSVFLAGACAQRDVDPADIEECDLKPALLDHVAPLEVAGSARAGVPALCGSFLGAMEDQGRLSGGRTLGFYIRALKAPFLAACEGRGQTLRAPGTKLGRNDPCPCGSGRKYKKCCMGRLGSGD